MTEVISCPSCSRQLRVPEDMQGRLVKCPGCGTAFMAGRDSDSAPAPAPAPSGVVEDAVEGEPPPSWTRESARDQGGEKEEESPGEAEATSPPTSRRRSSREEDPCCPFCGEPNPPDAARCRSCGEELEEEDRPWERPGAVRRDCEPHRGGLVLTLGIISLSLTPFALMFVCCWLLGTPFLVASLGLGITAWVMGQRDLGRMRQGVMDPQGRGTTQGGMICGIIGTSLAALAALGQVALVVLSLSLR